MGTSTSKCEHSRIMHIHPETAPSLTTTTDISELNLTNVEGSAFREQSIVMKDGKKYFLVEFNDHSNCPTMNINLSYTCGGQLTNSTDIKNKLKECEDDLELLSSGSPLENN